MFEVWVVCAFHVERACALGSQTGIWESPRTCSACVVAYCGDAQRMWRLFVVHVFGPIVVASGFGFASHVVVRRVSLGDCFARACPRTSRRVVSSPNGFVTHARMREDRLGQGKTTSGVHLAPWPFVVHWSVLRALLAGAPSRAQVRSSIATRLRQSSSVGSFLPGVGMKSPACSYRGVAQTECCTRDRGPLSSLDGRSPPAAIRACRRQSRISHKRPGQPSGRQI